MKITITLLYCMLFFGCVNSEKKEIEVSEASEVESAKSNTNSNDNNSFSLKQFGDYSQLFISKADDCDLLTSGELKEVLNATSVQREDNPNYCWYKTQLPSGTNLRIMIQRNPISKEHIPVELRSARDNPELHTLKISETKDTYLHSKGMGGTTQIINTNYDGGIVIKSIDLSMPKHTLETRTARHEDVIAIANFILKKYQNK